MPIDAAALDAAIRAETAEPFSGVVLIREHGETVFAHAYGLANRADALPNTIDTKFAVASGSKTFTAVAVLQLVEQGKLSLQTRLADCLDIPFPNWAPAITVHHLLSHTSGIPDYFDEDEMDDYEALWTERPTYSIRAPKDFLPLFQHLPMKFAPGERFHYNNGGYIVLGLIVEQAGGMPYTEYVQRHILDACGMRDSGFFRLDRLPANYATGYIRDTDGGWRSNMYAVPVVGGADGGICLTAPDMAKFWDALLGGRLLGEAAARAMLTPYAASQDDPAIHSGYGVWLKSAGDGTVIRYHAEGADPGVGFFSAVYPASGIDATVIGNTGDETWPAVRAVRAAVAADTA